LPSVFFIVSLSFFFLSLSLSLSRLLPPSKLPTEFGDSEWFDGSNGAEPSDATLAACFDGEVEAATPGLGRCPDQQPTANLALSTTDSSSHEFGVVLRRLRSGVSLNYRASLDEPQRACLRLTVPGGRASEGGSFAPGNPNCQSMAAAVPETDGWAPPLGAIALGARTMQEGGALGGLSRTQVELFCVDQLIMVEIVTEEEFVHFNFAFPTNKVAGESSVSGIEAVFQIVRQLLVPPSPSDPDGFVWEDDAMERALAGLAQQEEQEG
jgi:hypothetical protein